MNDEQETNIEENLIGSLNDLIQYFLQNAQVMQDNSDNRALLYRGQSDYTFDITPSVFRNGALLSETHMIKDLKQRTPEEFINLGSSLDQLIKMQHYGLPTRLLDITYNPLVALYFACAENFDKDGEIITFYDYLTPPDNPLVDSYANLAKYEGTNDIDLQNFILAKEPFMDETNHIRLDVLKKYFPHRCIFISAPFNNERIRRQHGAFLLFGIDVEQINPFQKEPFNIKHEVLKETKDGITRLLKIPANIKQSLLKELDALGINRAFLFPEFEHQACYVKQKYISQYIKEQVRDE